MTDEFIPYGRQSISEQDIDAVVEILRSNWLTTGPAVKDFEHAVSDRVGGHPVVAVSSGTAALHAAYAAAGVGPGTEIITTPLTFAATATAALHLGAEVVFADVDDDTLLLDPAKTAAAVSERTRAIVPVDYAGQPADMDAFREIADEAGAVLIEDASHSLGSTYKRRAVGTLADMTTFSFHPVKTVTTGEGGAVVAADIRFELRLRRFRNHGLVREPDNQRDPHGSWHQEVQQLGLNYRMPDILAALGTSQLAKLDRFAARRSELVDAYRTRLESVHDIRMLTQREDCRPAWHLFPVRVPRRSRKYIFDEMRREKVGVQVHYLPVHLHPIFRDRGHGLGNYPIAEQAYDSLITLPLYPDLSNTKLDTVIELLLQTVSRSRGANR